MRQSTLRDEETDSNRGYRDNDFSVSYPSSKPFMGISSRLTAHCNGSNRKYQFMELNLQKRITGLKDKIPDIQKTLDTVKFLQTRTVGTAITLCRRLQLKA